MKDKDVLDLIIEKISEEYRRKKFKELTINNKIIELENKLEQEKLKYIEFNEIIQSLKNSKNDKENLSNISEGISIAREIVFKFYDYID